ncbi:MAG: cytochrome c3 family protein, partial [Planctomycetota bacterium]
FSHVPPSFASSPPTPGTLIYYVGYATNAAGTNESGEDSFFLEPNQATSVTISNVTSGGMRISWTLPGTGAGDGTIVVMKQGVAVDQGPLDGTAHVASSSFGTGASEILSSGNYVVFRDTTGTQVDVDGLSPLTTYAVAVYTYAGTAAPSINYQQDSPQTASDTTLAGSAVGNYGTVWDTISLPEANDTPAAGNSPGTIPPAFPFSSVRTLPEASLIYFRGYADNAAGRGYSGEASFYTEAATQATLVRFQSTRTTETELDLTWEPGSGDGVIVLAREGTAVDADPVDGSEYTFDTTFGNGPEIGTGNYVVYVGTGSQTTIAGIFPDLTYTVAVYEYVGSGSGTSGIRYLQATPARGNSGHNASHGADCVNCHFGAGNFHASFVVPYGVDQQTACESCHNESGDAQTKLNFAIHTGNKYSADVDCGSCHEVHNNFDFTTTDTHTGGVTAANVEWIRPDTTKYVAGAGGPLGDEDALFQAKTGFYAWDDDNAPWNGLCQTCHQNTDWHRNDDSHPDHPPSHAHNMPSDDCRGCHSHTDGFRGAGDCLGCHNKPQEIAPPSGVYRRQIVESFLCTGDGTTACTTDADCSVAGGTCETGAEIVTRWDCVVCHAEGDAITGEADSTYHQKDGVQLKDVDTGVVYSDWSGLTPSQRSDFCLSCHDANGATIISSRPAPPPVDEPDATNDPLNPFNDGLTNAHEPDGLDGGTPAPHLRPRVLDVEAQFNTSNVS